MPAAPGPPPVEFTPASASTALLPQDFPLHSDFNLPSSSAFYVLLISTGAFAHTCKLPEATNFTLYIHTEDAKLCTATASPPVDTSNMAGVCYDFTVPCV